jgi:hypothetical protein
VGRDAGGVPAQESLRGTKDYAAAVAGRPVFFRDPDRILIDFGCRMVKESGRRSPAGSRTRTTLVPVVRHLDFHDQTMPGTTRTFRIPCRCSAAVAVTLGQAGTETTCPSCGAVVSVPRLRDLAAFEVKDIRPAVSGWQAGHAWILIGGVIAGIAAVAAGLLSRFDGGASQRLPDEPVIRAAVESADPVMIHKAWLAVKRSGVDRGAVAEELLVRQAADSVGRVAMLLWTVSAMGVMAAIAGGVAMLVTSSHKGSFRI